MFHLKFNFFHIGDQISTTAIPENIHNITGKKCAISDKKIWAFKHNPYVEHIDEKDAINLQTINLIPDCRIKEQQQAYIKMMNSVVSNSQTEYMCVNMGFNTVKLRHPRLYVYEDEKIIPNKITVHTSGSDRTRDSEPAIRHSSGEDSVRIMSDEIIDSILSNYSDYQLIQVGSLEDKPLGGHSIDLRGKLDYWQVAKEIASSAKFIGVNSGPMHIANCYPRVEKRIILQEFTYETLLTYKPGDIRNWLFSWVDPANTFFNKFEFDVGLTYTYKKI